MQIWVPSFAVKKRFVGHKERFSIGFEIIFNPDLIVLRLFCIEFLLAPVLLPLDMWLGVVKVVLWYGTLNIWSLTKISHSLLVIAPRRCLSPQRGLLCSMKNARQSEIKDNASASLHKTYGNFVCTFLMQWQSGKFALSLILIFM